MYYRVGQAAKQLNVSPSTIRNYIKQGQLPDKRNPAGHRILTQTDINTFLGIEPPQTKTVHYIRTSDHNPTRQQTQADLLTKTYGPPTRTYKDTGSGLNEKRPGLKLLLKHAKQGKISHVAITHKDRLTRFGYTYLEELLNTYGVKILVLEDNTTKSLHEELLQDFMSLIASFSGKYYRLRGYKDQKRFLEQVTAGLNEKS